MPDDIKYWVWMSMLMNIIPRKKLKLLDIFKSPENLWNASEAELKRHPLVTEEVLNDLKDKEKRSAVGRVMEQIDELDLDIVTINSGRYPELLKKISDPPVLIYVKGKLSTGISRIAVVGSRRSTSYGHFAAETLSESLSRCGFDIVSGMARGIDSCAHRGAIKALGVTTAVLGCGLDKAYPPENTGLMEQIALKGAVISEYPPGTIPIPRNFPARNRIISGLSKGVVVIEAAEHSGSLITAKFALDQGREVFALPGNISSENSVGTNKLIRDGAKIVTCIEDIFEELNLYICEMNIKNTRRCQKHTVSLKGLEGAELSIAEALVERDLHIDMIAAACNLDIRSVNSALIMMELKGIVEQQPGKIFRLK